MAALSLDPSRSLTEATRAPSDAAPPRLEKIERSPSGLASEAGVEPEEVAEELLGLDGGEGRARHGACGYARSGVAASTRLIAGVPWSISADSMSIRANIGEHDSEVMDRSLAAWACSRSPTR